MSDIDKIARDENLWPKLAGLMLVQTGLDAVTISPETLMGAINAPAAFVTVEDSTAGITVRLVRGAGAAAMKLTDAQLVEHLHARGWRIEPSDLPMIREAAAALSSGLPHRLVEAGWYWDGEYLKPPLGPDCAENPS